MESSDSKKPLKITFFSVLPPFRGGISSFSQLVLKNLNLITSVDSFTFSKLYPKLLFPGKSQEDKNLKENHPRIVSTFNPFTYLSARKRLRKTDPDVFIVNYWMTLFGPMYAFFSGAFGKKVLRVALIHNLTPHEKRFFDNYFNRLFLKRYDAFVVLSEQVKNDLLTQKPDAPLLLLNHPPYSHFGASSDKKESRALLNIPKNSKVLLFFGLIRDYKGLDILIDSLNHLDESYFLLVAGEIYGNDKIYRDKIEGCKNKNIILRDNYIPDEEVHLYFSAADLCVLPYKKGTQSGVQAISESFSTPVLVSRNGGLHENIQEGSNGFITNELSAEALSSKIEEVFTGGKLDIVREKLKVQFMQKGDEWKNFAIQFYDFIQK